MEGSDIPARAEGTRSPKKANTQRKEAREYAANNTSQGSPGKASGLDGSMEEPQRSV